MSDSSPPGTDSEAYSERTIAGVGARANQALGVRANIAFDNLRNSLEMSLSRLIAQGQSADSRAGMILSTNIAMMGALVAVLSASRVADLSLLGAVAAAIALALGGISVGHVAYATFPRSAQDSDTVLFFGVLARLSNQDYNERMRSMAPDAYLDDLARQCHAVAGIVSVKFRAIRTAFVLLFMAITPWMAALAAVSKNF